MQLLAVVQALGHALETNPALQRPQAQKVAAMSLVLPEARGAEVQMWREAGVQAKERTGPLQVVQVLWVVPLAPLPLPLLLVPVQYALPASVAASVSFRSSRLPAGSSSGSLGVLRACVYVSFVNCSAFGRVSHENGRCRSMRSL